MRSSTPSFLSLLLVLLAAVSAISASPAPEAARARTVTVTRTVTRAPAARTVTQTVTKSTKCPTRRLEQRKEHRKHLKGTPLLMDEDNSHHHHHHHHHHEHKDNEKREAKRAAVVTRTRYVTRTAGARSTVTRTRTSTICTKAASTTAPTTTRRASTSTTTTRAAATTTAGTISPSGSLVQSQVGYHNAKRALHFTSTESNPQVTWNDTLADFAYTYALQCNSGHSGGAYGENLAWGAPPNVWSDEQLFELWYDESKGYDYSNNYFEDATGHFTQLVWKGTTQIGCAIVTCPGNAGLFGTDTPYKSLTCEYASRRGNVQGAFVSNVLPPGNA